MDLVPARIPANVKNGQILTHGDDSTILATFDDVYVDNEYKSEQMGKSHKDHMIEVKLEYPGNILTNYISRFFPSDKEKVNYWSSRFPNQWNAFKNQEKQVPDGTPIEHWPPLSKAMVYALKAANVFTVEQIASVKDVDVQSALGLEGRKLRDLAMAFVNPQVGMVELARERQEKQDLKNQVETMQRQIEDLVRIKTSSISSEDSASVTLDEEKPRRGRPPKQVSTAA